MTGTIVKSLEDIYYKTIFITGPSIMNTDSKTLGTYRLALIDDESDILVLAEKFLYKFDKKAKVFSYTSPKDFLKKYKENNHFFDVIVSDYEMTDLNGLELLIEVRKSSNTPFIIFTGKGREEIVIKALNLGVDFYVQKSTDSILMYTDLYHHIIKAYEKKRAEETQHILNTLPIGMLISDKEGHILDGNQFCLRIVNLTKEELLGMSAWDIYYDPKDRDEFIRSMEGKGQVKDLKEVFKRKYGRKGRWVKKEVIVSSTKLSLQDKTYYLSIIKEA